MSEQIIREIEVARAPACLALDRSGERLAVGFADERRVVVHAVADGRVLREIAIEDEPGVDSDQMPDDPYLLADLSFCGDGALLVGLRTVFDNHGSAARSVRVYGLGAASAWFVACSAWDTLHDVDGEAMGCIATRSSARADRLILSADQGFWEESDDRGGGLQQWIRVLDVATGAVVREWREGDAGLVDVLSPVALDAGGLLAAVAELAHVVVLDVATGARVATHAMGDALGSASQVMFTDTGELVVEAGGGLHALDARGARPLASSAEGARCLRLTPDARAAAWLEPCDDGTLQLVRQELASGARRVIAGALTEVVAVSGHGESFAFARDGAVLVVTTGAP